MMASAFHWEQGQAPAIEEHSFEKLRVLRDYLRTYFDVLNQGVHHERFKLDLVDGFAGGGLYLHNGAEVAGSPLVMLEESKDAEQRLNERRVKQLRFDVKHHFVEKDHAHATYLRSVLDDRGYLPDRDSFELYEGSFDEVLDRIISNIRPHPRQSGRSIFLLDQCGYTDADIRMVRSIGERLPKAEVILTVSIDAMLNLSTRENVVQRLVSAGYPKGLIQEVLRGGSDDHHKALMQRILPGLALDETDFNWFTPFFIKPAKSRRELWFIHFSRDAKARDVMLECHWKIHNSFAHYGESFGPKMLGFEALERQQMPLLTFNRGDKEETIAALTEQFMPQLHRKLKAQPLRLMDVLDHFGNRTAATIADFNDIGLAVRDVGEVQIVDASGRPRSRSLRIIKPDDAFVLHPQLMLPIGKR